MPILKVLLLTHLMFASVFAAVIEAPISISFHLWRPPGGALRGVLRFDEKNENRGTILTTLTQVQRKEMDRIRLDLEFGVVFSGPIKRELKQILRTYDATTGTIAINAIDSKVKKMRQIWERKNSHQMFHREVIASIGAYGLAEIVFNREAMFNISFDFNKNRSSSGLNANDFDLPVGLDDDEQTQESTLPVSSWSEIPVMDIRFKKNTPRGLGSGYYVIFFDLPEYLEIPVTLESIENQVATFKLTPNFELVTDQKLYRVDARAIREFADPADFLMLKDEFAELPRERLAPILSAMGKLEWPAPPGRDDCKGMFENPPRPLN